MDSLQCEEEHLLWIYPIPKKMMTSGQIPETELGVGMGMMRTTIYRNGRWIPSLRGQSEEKALVVL